MDEDAQLRGIVEARKAAYKLNVPIMVCLVIGFATSVYFPVVAPVFGFVAGAIVYQRLVSIARMPCPGCGAPFGSDSSIVLGVGTNSCQNCGLKICGPLP